MTHAEKSVEKKQDRVRRRAIFWIPSAVIPVFAGLILLALSTGNETHGEILTKLGAESFPPASVTVRRKPGAADTVVSVDADRLRRAIINVYENACQASAGPVGRRPASRKHRVTIETRRRKDRLEIVIADNGQGIPPETLSKIFEPLFSTKNFGVGLPMVKEIMEQHGGDVEITSQEERGMAVEKFRTRDFDAAHSWRALKGFT